MADASGEGSAFIRCMRDIRGAFYAQRSTILISLAAAYVLAFPAVTREVYRILADDAYDLTSLEPRQIVARGITWLPIVFAFLSLFLASAAIWYVGRDLAGQVEGEQLRARSVKGYLLRWLPAAFALLLPLGAAWGLYSASLDAQAIGALQYNIAPPFDFDYPSPMADTQKSMQRLLGSMGAVAWLIRGAAYACVGLAVVLLASMALIGWRQRGSAFGARLRYGLLIVAAGIVALFSLSIAVPVLGGVPRWIGTVAVFNLFIVALTLFVGLGILVSDRFGIPVLLIVIGFAVVLSLFDVNDNHVVQQVEAKQKGSERGGAQDEFDVWLKSRADLAAYKSEPYPVFVVSAAGGGLYAAHHTARFLARIQDHCPHFAQHIFAISGVSGGSVGAAVFASLLNTKVPTQETVPNCKAFGRRGPLEQDVTAILSRDYLSPIVAATLFPDFLQRFIPVAIPKFDRGQVLDAVLEAAWRKRFPDKPNPLAMPMMDLWDPKGVTPALVLNATHVATGGRFAMAPFMPRRYDQTAIKLEWVQGHLQNRSVLPTPGDPEPTGHEDLKLSSAAGISARFPWIMPPATVLAQKQDKNRKNTLLRLVDGGYFENSGADTAGDLIRAMEHAKTPQTPPFKIYTLVLTSYDNVVFGGNFNDETPLGEFIAPLRGLLSTRQARGDMAIIRTLDYLCPDLDNCNTETENRGWHNKAKWIFATLNLKDSKLPLSWHLSEFSRRFVGLHAGNPRDCGNVFHAVVPLWTGLPNEPEPPPPLKPPRVMAALNNANCAASIVCAQLANKKLPFASGTGKMENYCDAWDTAGPAPAPGVVPTSGK